MNSDKQKVLLQYMLSSPDTFAKCKGIVKSSYFAPEHRKAVDFIHLYYDEYHNLPDLDLIAAETKSKFKHVDITRDKVNFCCNEIERFCRQSAVVEAVKNAVPLIDAEDYGLIESMVKAAVTVSLNRDLGLDYLANPEERLEEQRNQQPRISTGLKYVDEALGGGVARTEMIMYSAGSGGGKSINMSNLGKEFMYQGLNVLYLSLELSEAMIGQRFDMMLTGVAPAPRVVWENQIENIVADLAELSDMLMPNGKRIGNLQIKRLPVGSNANDIRAYLREYELTKGYIPDLIIVDYLDLMNPIEKISLTDVFTKDKLAAEQLREIGFEYNCVIATASQQNRGGIEKDAEELNQSVIAGGISKVNTVDIYIAITMTPQQKQAGQMFYTFLKTRSSDGVGRVVELQWIGKSLTVANADPTKKRDSFVVDGGKRETTTNPGAKKRNQSRSLDQLMAEHGAKRKD